MSLVPTWVLAQDGKLYEDPTLRGPGWYLCFDDNDPPELVVKVAPGMDKKATREAAARILAEAGIKNYKRLRFQGVSGRQIGRAASFFLELTEPIPVPHKFDSVTDRYPFREGVFYAFGRKIEGWPVSGLPR